MQREVGVQLPSPARGRRSSNRLVLQCPRRVCAFNSVLLCMSTTRDCFCLSPCSFLGIFPRKRFAFCQLLLQCQSSWSCRFSPFVLFLWHVTLSFMSPVLGDWLIYPPRSWPVIVLLLCCLARGGFHLGAYQGCEL